MGADYLEYCIRDQQQDEMLDYLKCLLAQALNTGQTIALPPLVWLLAATATPERMQALL